MREGSHYVVRLQADVAISYVSFEDVPDVDGDCYIGSRDEWAECCFETTNAAWDCEEPVGEF